VESYDEGWRTPRYSTMTTTKLATTTATPNMPTVIGVRVRYFDKAGKTTLDPRR
jgi:hypothetical protein